MPFCSFLSFVLNAWQKHAFAPYIFHLTLTSPWGGRMDLHSSPETSTPNRLSRARKTCAAHRSWKRENANSTRKSSDAQVGRPPTPPEMDGSTTSAQGSLATRNMLRDLVEGALP
ncbi:hypothetical protein CDAR_607171 [Caerostris darwini]|uniref:Uncharacterized protein n=1 Tax=Caerostris darwini TaxID=1538125 RepID=A0AAV4QID7_9ARAC|nr:hypothetical protein CDAR_607171 [Caerostris darwini]